MTLADFVADVAKRRKTMVVYASDGAPDVADHFESRNVTVERKSIAPGGPDGFVVLRDEDGFVGAFGIDKFAELLDPPLFRPTYRTEVSEPWRSLYEILDNTLFASFGRRQLLGAAREIENRAWRVGAGTLRVGFQSPDALAAQMDVYRRLVEQTDLSIHVFVEAGDEAFPVPDGVELFRSEGTEIGDFWFLVYDAAGDPLNACALLAEERALGTYYGFWTYDEDRVAALSTYLQDVHE
ncbi:Diguanylate Cyclase and Two-component system sensory domain-containing protein [Halomicrobium zhouii]|uniref:Diguanylate Cyclase and Two-component system sensory domain-containing protein n=1 Tax=Halomicrobium zhouii TaxID=767519 RepID=A0A1I6KLX8_9EURY|nr:DICT sensory domain-containing protein [Halomicrobium zhouii]SFR92206.1 Diguanylate Cyclase and Two-component system sensory domain-containing protein [Halomicrobium zhouii]